MLTRRGLACGSGAGLLLAGCASPEPAVFRLTAVPGTQRRGGPRSLELRQVGIPGYLDRPEIVRGGADFRLQVLNNERWGEPLGDLVGRVLAENLMLRLPGTTVFAEGGALRGDSNVVVEAEILRFEAGSGGTVELLAQVAMQVRDGRGGRDLRTVRLEVPGAGPGTAALVASMSATLGRLADAIAEMVAPG
ncbi:PqiC family protein [Roseomonas chloroacetimidivorans]|uniref:PqiC family protein n=1 Tax=Roseomonas chloroacetimidivorans TaxID=1766656 RepID=UPI003C76F334